MTDDPTDAGAFVTTADVPLLNRATIDEACRIARQVAAALLAVAALGVAAWAWIVWQTVDAVASADDGGDFSTSPVVYFSDGDASAGDYANALAQTAPQLLIAAAVAGIAVSIRLVAAHVGNAVGVDVSAVAVGDPLPDSWADDDELGADA